MTNLRRSSRTNAVAVALWMAGWALAVVLAPLAASARAAPAQPAARAQAPTGALAARPPQAPTPVARTPTPRSTRSTSAPPANATSVTVSGTVANGTAGAAVPTGLLVTATELDSGATRQIAAVATRARAGGGFSVSGLPGEPGDQFAVSTSYEGVTYVSEVTPTATDVLTIYETSTANPTLSIPSETLTLLTGKGGTLDALQLVTVDNSTDRTFVGTPDPAGSGLQQTVELPVPTDISSFAPSNVSSARDGQPVSADPILPGDTNITYLYTVPITKSGWSMTRPVIYPTGREEILLDPALSLSAPGLTFRKTILVGTARYRNYQGGVLTPGSTLSALITYRTSGRPLLREGLIAGGVLVLLVVLGFALLRLRRRRRSRGRAEPEDTDEHVELADDLAGEIGALDGAHAAGRISDADYADVVADLKARLHAVTSAGADRNAGAGGHRAARPAGRAPQDSAGDGPAGRSQTGGQTELPGAEPYDAEAEADVQVRRDLYDAEAEADVQVRRADLPGGGEEGEIRPRAGEGRRRRPEPVPAVPDKANLQGEPQGDPGSPLPDSGPGNAYLRSMEASPPPQRPAAGPPAHSHRAGRRRRDGPRSSPPGA